MSRAEERSASRARKAHDEMQRAGMDWLRLRLLQEKAARDRAFTEQWLKNMAARTAATKVQP